MIERKMTWDEAVAEIARLTKLRALDEQQFAKLKASFDEVVKQRDEAARLLDDVEVSWQHIPRWFLSRRKALKARQAGEGDEQNQAREEGA